MTENSSTAGPVSRFTFNLTMTLGFLWIAVSGVCSARFVAIKLFTLAPDAALPFALTVMLGPYLLIPGFLLWGWGKRQAGYVPARDLKSPLWRIPQLIGIACAVAYWIFGATILGHTLERFPCPYDYGSCGQLLEHGIMSVLFPWLTGWMFYWVSTRP
jgi:hypothetical protein